MKGTLHTDVAGIHHVLPEPFLGGPLSSSDITANDASVNYARFVERTPNAPQGVFECMAILQKGIGARGDCPMTRRVSVIVPSTGRASLAQCISSITAQDYPKDLFEIIVVFDGATVYSPSEEKNLFPLRDGPEVRMLHQERRGPAAARNLGAMGARGEVLAFIDDDCIADPAWLSNLVTGVDGHAGAEGRVEPLGPPHPLVHSVANRGGLYLTANVAFEREWFERVGGFDERFRHPAGEDFDLAWKILEAGGEIAYADEAIVYHPVRYESFQEFRKRLEAWDAPRILAKKHPRKFREFTGRGWATHALYYIVVDPPYQLLRWRKDLLRDSRALAQFGLRMFYRSFYGATQPFRRKLKGLREAGDASMEGSRP